MANGHGSFLKWVPVLLTGGACIAAFVILQTQYLGHVESEGHPPSVQYMRQNKWDLVRHDEKLQAIRREFEQTRAEQKDDFDKLDTKMDTILEKLR